jgi:hypothetical protein
VGTSALSKRVQRAQRRIGLGVEHRSRHVNMYHCCVQRTASQWFRRIFNDEVFYRHTGLHVQPYIEVGLNSAVITRPFPRRSMVVHLYVSRSTYDALPKPPEHRGFFVTRDPRDITVSFYFAAARSHKPIGIIPELRSRLTVLGQEEGMAATIDALDEMGLYRAQRSWGPPTLNGNVPVLRYEDLASDHVGFLRGLFDRLDVPIPDAELEQLCERKSFQSLTGRAQGEEDVNSHLRSGVPGDWQRYLTPELTRRLDRVTDNLPAHLGY